MIIWGDNEYGQLGLGQNSVKQTIIPTQLLSMRSLPVYQIFSGANHSGCLTHSGAIFVWGKNNFGQLGMSVNRKFVKFAYFFVESYNR